MLKLLAFGLAYLQVSLHLIFPDVHVVGGFAANLEGRVLANKLLVTRPWFQLQ